ncbi:MAG: YbaK/EbsC family protein [Oscillibacter sp.]|nr:YbaK/EbsC family protein [Oscillibacter sp.]
MFHVSEIQTTAPTIFKTPLQKQVYEALSELGIPFERVDTDEAITMEDCVAIDEKLQMKMVKTLFLCTRHQAELFLFITRGDKPFSSKAFSAALDVGRVSFAPAELMDSLLGTKIGAATVFSALRDTENRVRIVFDRDVLTEEWYGCSDGTTTGYMKISTQRILHDLLPAAGHPAEIVEV